MTPELEQLLAKDAIRDLVLRYCRAVDRRDLRSLRPLYTSDAIDDHGAMFCGAASDYIQWLPGMLESMQVLSHQVLNHLIVVQGDRAEGEVYTIAYHLSKDDKGDDVEIVIGGRYLDKYRCEQGVWKFAHRKIVLDWSQTGPPSSQPGAPVTAGAARGAALPDDPSADFFEFLNHTGRN